MSLLFLIPLVVSFTTAYASRKSAEDLAEIMSAAAIFSLIMSLMLSPWQIQLLILLLTVTKPIFWLK